MRIVNREAFLALPAETLFSKYEPCVFEDFCIKGDTLGNDFLYQSITDAINCESSEAFNDALERAEVKKESLSLDFDCQGRDGCFDADQLFAVWEKADVEALIGRLQRVRDVA
jgi:hypothetical protein